MKNNMIVTGLLTIAALVSIVSMFFKDSGEVMHHMVMYIDFIAFIVAIITKYKLDILIGIVVMVMAIILLEYIVIIPTGIMLGILIWEYFIRYK